MSVPLTCACGRQQEVPLALAGTTTPCVACGKPLRVPAMGRAVGSGKRTAPRPEPSPFAALETPSPSPPRSSRASSTQATALLLALTVVSLLLLAGLGVALLYRQGYLTELDFFAQSSEPPIVQPAVAPPAAPAAAPVRENTPAPAEPVVKPLPAPADPSGPVNKPAETPPAQPPVNKPADPAPPAVAKPVVVKPPDEKPATPKRPFKEGDTFLQDLVVKQKSRFLVQGIPVATFLEYRLVSRYTVQKVHAEGALAVEQKIESATLVQADELTQGLLAGPIAQLPGTALALEVSPRGEVTKLGGADGAAQFAVPRVPGGLGVQMASLLDADGYKEIGQATFYQPEALDKAGRWTRAMTHNWGALGGWNGEVSYAFPGPGKDAQVKVPYSLKLAYQEPKGPRVPGAVPVQITASNFQAPQAGGVLLFDSQQRKTVAMEERFLVRGKLGLVVLGQNTPAEIEEEQLFQMRIVAK
jgi:hypothetical protein